MSKDETGVSRWFVWTLTLACSLVVANLYYSQPLLGSIANSFGVSEASTGAVVGGTQIGYAVGLLALVPLGDILRRRPLVLGLLVVDTVALVVSAAAPTLTILVVAGVFVGVTSVVVQILVPYAATEASPAQRPRVIAALLTGMLVAILLSRTFSGIVAGGFGNWRVVYVAGAGFMILTFVMLLRLMPSEPPEIQDVGYFGQLRAIGALIRTEPILRRRSLMGLCCFGAFNCFWTTSVFLLESPPYRYSQIVIGLFALLGAAGAISAKVVGPIAATPWQRPLSGILLVALIASFAALFGGGELLIVLIPAVLVLDAAVQGVHLLNQTVIYELSDAARARLTTVYMTSYFVGGALGSAGGAVGFGIAGWPGACVVGGALAVLGTLVWLRDAQATRNVESGSTTDDSATGSTAAESASGGTSTVPSESSGAGRVD